MFIRKILTLAGIGYMAAGFWLLFHPGEPSRPPELPLDQIWQIILGSMVCGGSLHIMIYGIRTRDFLPMMIGIMEMFILGIAIIAGAVQREWNQDLMNAVVIALVAHGYLVVRLDGNDIFSSSPSATDNSG